MTRSLSVAALVCVGLIAIPALADAQITKHSAGYLFRSKYKKGQVIKYRLDTTISGPQSMTIEMPMKMTIIDVVKDVADIEAAVGPISMNGKQMGDPDKGVQTQRFKMNSLGKVVGGVNENMGVGATLPEKPVKIGGSYTATLPLGAAAGGGNAKATYTFAGIKNVDGKSVAELNVIVSSAGPQQITGSGKMFLVMADGSLHKADLDMQMSMPTRGSGSTKASQPMRFNIVMKRV